MFLVPTVSVETDCQDALRPDVYFEGGFHMSFTSFLSVLLFAVLTSLAHAAPDTRGLRVVAKDPATGQSDEVKLYNKSYAVIIGIDSYKNLPRDRQL
jgi:hypothetical protein